MCVQLIVKPGWQSDCPHSRSGLRGPHIGPKPAIGTFCLGDGALYAHSCPPDAAIVIAEATATRLSADAEALDDDALRAEVDFANELLDLMRGGAPQGSLYGY